MCLGLPFSWICFVKIPIYVWLCQDYFQRRRKKGRQICGSLWLIVDGSSSQQQHPTVHSGGVTRRRAVALAVGVSDMWQVTGDMWQVTPDFSSYINICSYWWYYPKASWDSVSLVFFLLLQYKVHFLHFKLMCE